MNIGREYAASALDADQCHWRDSVDIHQYDTIGFSVIYPLFTLNIVPFLTRHGIEPLRSKRNSHRVIIGGPGVSNLNDALRDIADETYHGEADGDYTDIKGWRRMRYITTPPVFGNGKAVVELTRGCKYRCKFCEYTHVLGGTYREKNVVTAVSQLEECLRRGIKRVTLRTANLAGYTDLDDLMGYCQRAGIYQGWADISILDAERILKWLKPLKITAPKIGVESFDEATRKRIGKGFTDDYLDYVFDEIMAKCSLIHVYLIFGLPDDNYDNWRKWVYKLAEKRKRYDHNIRIDFSMTNFNPCLNTPMADATLVDFQKKDEFLDKWIETTRDSGFYKRNWNAKYGRDYGRHGRKEASYRMIMMLRQCPPETLTPRLIHALPRGVQRWTNDRTALRFINYDFKN